ncbi:cyclic nucleotide-binding domain-containing protein [uncultured Tateyamaria sp.]|uniref:cyclic nucleotide-binding domain-containing protein n=1 Tax=uncultured Tateyamaria sp. TaxID=455651 RepID=UPI0026389A60|nr:cyclic nucleotide-binding domain-containing protein [uncultured Tateyamaria sp.]
MLSDFIAPETVVLLAGAALTIGYLIIHQVMLRLMVLLGTANLIGLGNLLWHQSKMAVPRAHRDIYPMFQSLPPGDFRNLVQYADRKVLQEAIQVTTEGAPVDKLYYVISGGIEVVKRGERFNMPPNLFVGEVAYITGQKSAATTCLPAGAEVLEWDVATLRARAAKRARFKLAIEAMISSDLALKVAFAVAPHRNSWVADAQAHRSQKA